MLAGPSVPIATFSPAFRKPLTGAIPLASFVLEPGFVTGKLADMIMMDLHMPNMQPLNNIAKNIVYSGSKQNVKMTMIHGKILYRDGKFYVPDEPEDIYRKANEIINAP